MKTKKLICLFLIIAAFVACNNKSSKDESAVKTEENQTKTGDAKNCDEFIDQYEEWMDNYLEFLEKYIKNPMDSELASDYMKLAQEGMVWMNQWNTKLYACASKEKYQKRFDEITEKADKKMEELGID